MKGYEKIILTPPRFYALHKAYKDKVMIMHVDRHWHKFRLAVRNGKSTTAEFLYILIIPIRQNRFVGFYRHATTTNYYSLFTLNCQFPALRPLFGTGRKINAVICGH